MGPTDSVKSNPAQPNWDSLMLEPITENRKKQHRNIQNKTKYPPPPKKKFLGGKKKKKKKILASTLQPTAGSGFLAGSFPSCSFPSTQRRLWFRPIPQWNSFPFAMAQKVPHHNPRFKLRPRGNRDSQPRYYFSRASTLSEALKIRRNPDKKKEMKQ